MAVNGESGERAPSPTEVANFLWAHADATAAQAVGRLGGPLCFQNLERFLRDRQCLRCSASLCFDAAPLAADHFAEPVVVQEGPERHCCLYIHPRYEMHPEVIPHFVAYMTAAIIYGDQADAELCGRLGSRLVQEPEDTFTRRIDAWAGMP